MSRGLDGRKVLDFNSFDNKSLIIQEENNIKNFRKSYLNLLKKANIEYKTNLDLRGHILESGQTHISDEVYSTIIDRYDDLTRILEELVKGYSLKAIFEWPDRNQRYRESESAISYGISYAK